MVRRALRQVGDDSTSSGRSVASCSMFGPLGCGSGSVRTLLSARTKRSCPPSDWPMAIGLTPSSASVFAENGVSATIRFGAAAAGATPKASRNAAVQAARRAYVGIDLPMS